MSMTDFGCSDKTMGKMMRRLDLQIQKNWKTKYLFIIAGQSLSLIGSTAVQFSVIWWLSTTLGSPIILAFASIAAYIPNILLGSFVGVWLDRLNKKYVIIAADVFTGVISVIFALTFYLGTPTVWMTLFFLGLRAIGGVFQSPAIQAVVPSIVPKDQLIQANAWDQFLQSGALMIGPVLGAVMYAALPLPIILFSDLTGAVIASISLMPVKIPYIVRVDDNPMGFVREWKEGLQIFLMDKRLFVLTLSAAICMIFFMPITAFYPLMTSDYFQGTACEASSVELLYSAGMMSGTFVINRFGNKLQYNAICVAFIGLFGLGSTTLISGFLPKSDEAFWIFAFMCFGMGISAVFYNIPYIAYIQETIPSIYHGRAFSLLNSIISLTMPLGLLVAGPLSEIKGIQFWFSFSGIMIVSITLIAVCVLAKKHLHTIVRNNNKKGCIFSEQKGEI